MRTFVCLMLSVVLAAGCGSGDKEPGKEGGPCLEGGACDAGLVCVNDKCTKPGSDCTPDNTQACTCTGDQQGTQTCQQDSTWGECACGDTCTFFRTGDADCDVCIDEKCYTQCQACADDADCSALKECLEGCSSSQCLQDCGQTHAAGMELYNALAGPAPSGCIGTLCTSACSPEGCNPSDVEACTCQPTGQGTRTCQADRTWGACECGQTCDFFRTGLAECDACIDTKCLQQCQACAENEDCRALKECMDACPNDPTCFQNCNMQYPDGFDLYWALVGSAPSGCIGNLCDSECSP